MEKYLLCAEAVGTHGVHGMIKLKNYTDSPKILAGLKTVYIMDLSGNYSPRKIIKASVQKQAVIASIEGIETLDDAIVFKGNKLYAARDDYNIDENSFFIADLIGLPVIDAESGKLYGTLQDVETQRVQDIYVVAEENGNNFMIPAVGEFVRRIEIAGENKGIYVKLIEGMRKE